MTDHAKLDAAPDPVPDPVDEISVRPDAIAILLHDLPPLGLDAPALLREAGIDPRGPAGRPSAAEVFRAYGLASHALDDPWLGLRLGRDRGLAWLGPFGAGVAASFDIRQALAVAARYSELLVDGQRLSLSIDGPTTTLSLRMVEGLDPRGVQVILQSSVLVATNVNEDLVSRPDITRTLSFACPSPPPNSPVLADLHRPWRVLRFDAPAWSLSLPTACLRLPLASAPDPALKLVLAALETERNRLRASRSFVSQVRLSLLGMLSEGPSLPSVARQLQVSPRTLQGRLADARTSFQAELDRVRLDVARRYLRGTTDPIALIAARVGFGAPAAFTRFFRAASGLTPRAYREAEAEAATAEAGA